MRLCALACSRQSHRPAPLGSLFCLHCAVRARRTGFHILSLQRARYCYTDAAKLLSLCGAAQSTAQSNIPLLENMCD